MNPRFRYFEGRRKMPWKWLAQTLRTFIPYWGQREEDERMKWIWLPHFAEEWESENPSPYLYPGDAGYETAKYEIGFIVSSGSSKLFKVATGFVGAWQTKWITKLLNCYIACLRS
jgi:hypothetical protein